MMSPSKLAGQSVHEKPIREDGCFEEYLSTPVGASSSNAREQPSKAHELIG